MKKYINALNNVPDFWQDAGKERGFIRRFILPSWFKSMALIGIRLAAGVTGEDIREVRRWTAWRYIEQRDLYTSALISGD